MFSNDAGKYCPETKKIRLKWVIYWVIGLILTVLIPTCLVYLEAWEFNWNVVRIVWAEDSSLDRVGHFLFGMMSILCFFFLGYMTPENINGNKEQVAYKIILRFLMGILTLVWITCFILAIVLY